MVYPWVSDDGAVSARLSFCTGVMAKSDLSVKFACTFVSEL